MKHSFIKILSVLLFCPLFAHANQLVTQYNLSKAVEVAAPLCIDSVNMQGKPYQVNYLINNQLKFKANETINTPSGVLRLVAPFQSMQVAHFEAMSTHFNATTLEITSNCPTALYLNNKLVETNSHSNNTLSYSIQLEPARRYDFDIQVLITDTFPKLEAQFVGKDSITTASHMKSRYMLENTLFGHRVDQVTISPNGRYLLTRYSDKFEIGKTNTYTVLSERKSSKELLTDQGGRSLSWMPLSNLIYYTIESQHGYEIRTINPQTLKESSLAKDVPSNQFTWSPQEDFLIIATEEKARPKGEKLIHVASRMDRQPGSRTGYLLSKYDLKTGLFSRMTYGYHNTNLADIAPNGQTLLFTTWNHNKKERPFTSTYLVEMNVHTFKADTIAIDSYLYNATYCPLSEDILLSAGPESFEKIGMNCGNHPIPNNYDMQAYIWQRKDHKIVPISKDFDPSIGSMWWSTYDHNIYATVEEGSRKNLYLYNTKSLKWNKMSQENDMIYNVSYSKTSPYAAYTSYGMTTSRSAYTYNLKNNKSTLFANPMQEILNDIELGKVEDFNFTTQDNTEIEGMICYPPSFDASKKYPMIVYYYGGTSPSDRYMEFYYSAELLASRGYMVYVVNPSGATGYGQEFSARHVNAWGKRTANDIIEGTKAVCAKYTCVDASKIGCLGASYGGFMTEYLQTQTDIFACAISHAGISNLSSYFGEGFWGVGYNTVAAADSYPWNNPELYTKQGALWQADKIHTPLLMVHGTVDTNVPIGESISLYNALKILNREVALVEVVGQNHHILDLEKRQLWHATIMAWFAKYLQNQPTWWNTLYPTVYADSFE